MNRPRPGRETLDLIRNAGRPMTGLWLLAATTVTSLDRVPRTSPIAMEVNGQGERLCRAGQYWHQRQRMT